MKKSHIIHTFIVLSFVLSSAPRLSAQFVTSAKAELGGRQFNGTLSSSKFTEYRDLPGGLFVNTFSLNFMNDGYTDFLSVWGSNVGQRDQTRQRC